MEEPMQDTLMQPPGILKLIAHEVRWKLLQQLAHSDYRVNELVDRLHLPQNLVSYHLKQLRHGQLVSERRSSADERAIFYSLDLKHFQDLYRAAGETLHPGLTTDITDSAVPFPQYRDGKHAPLRVLFLCTENSARSQMAEALLRHLSDGTVEAFSAGSLPADHIHPLALRCMQDCGIDISQQHPKHLEQFRGQHFAAIVTVCDRVMESCPTFPGDPERIHWSFLDPATVQGTDEERLQAFMQTSLQLSMRIRFLLIVLERERKSRES
jgi:ArsR family transcriptional regulator, arsenate/arsenite/antimonite-responsive transcriptional repressor / arsenate reductase (thioredoxin)